MVEMIYSAGNGENIRQTVYIQNRQNIVAIFIKADTYSTSVLLDYNQVRSVHLTPMTALTGAATQLSESPEWQIYLVISRRSLADLHHSSDNRYGRYGPIQVLSPNFPRLLKGNPA